MKIILIMTTILIIIILMVIIIMVLIMIIIIKMIIIPGTTAYGGCGAGPHGAHGDVEISSRGSR
jgi:hypothetical protein